MFCNSTKRPRFRSIPSEGMQADIETPKTLVWAQIPPKKTSNVEMRPQIRAKKKEGIFVSFRPPFQPPGPGVFAFGFTSGLRSVDHCVECLCSPSGNPYSDGLAGNALAMLVSGLRGVKAWAFGRRADADAGNRTHYRFPRQIPETCTNTSSAWRN